MIEHMDASEYQRIRARPHKYHAVKTHVDGHRFDSRREAERYMVLRDMERNGEISNLHLQPKFRLVVNGVHICNYFADFLYIREGRRIVEDVKSAPTKTAVYKLKKQLMLACYGIQILET